MLNNGYSWVVYCLSTLMHMNLNALPLYCTYMQKKCLEHSYMFSAWKFYMEMSEITKCPPVNNEVVYYIQVCLWSFRESIKAWKDCKWNYSKIYCYKCTYLAEGYIHTAHKSSAAFLIVTLCPNLMDPANGLAGTRPVHTF